MSDAKTEWVEVARYVLAKQAAKGKTITYGQFYDLLRGVYFLGWPSRKNGHSWMHTYVSPILLELAGLNRVHGEPMLSSLIRNADTGHVGAGYDGAVFARYGYTPERVISHAEIEAGKCFKHFG